MAERPPPKRRYVSPRRAQSAADTRHGILSAAHELFVAHGYTATTIDQIASEAGVSRQTVFVSVGNKQAIFLAVRDLAMAGDETQIPIAERDWFREALDEPDPVRALRLHARNVVRLHRRAAALNEVLRTSAGADPEVRDLWLTAERQRRADVATFIKVLRQKTRLKNSLGLASATDLMWAFTSADTFQRLVVMRRWTPSRYERWLADTFLDQFLPPPARTIAAASGSR